MLFPLGLEMLLDSSAGLGRTVDKVEGVGTVPTPHSPRLPFGNWDMVGNDAGGAFMLGLLVVPDGLFSIPLPHKGYSFPGLPWHRAGCPCWPKANSASLAAFIYKPIDSATVLESSLESSGLRP